MQCLRVHGYSVVYGVACKDNDKVDRCNNAGVVIRKVINDLLIG